MINRSLTIAVLSLAFFAPAMPLLAGQREISRRFVGTKVGEILDFYRVEQRDIYVHDDPTATLGVISFLIEGRTSVFVRFEPRIRNDDREWDVKKLRDCQICEVSVVILEDWQMELGGQIVTLPDVNVQSSFGVKNTFVFSGWIVAAFLLVIIARMRRNKCKRPNIKITNFSWFF